MAFILLSSCASFLNVDNAKAESVEDYDNAYLADYDYSMGNEYNNYTGIISADFSYSSVFSKPLDPAQAADYPILMARRSNMDFVRANNEYFLYFFDNTDTLKLFRSSDFNYARTIDSSSFQNKVEITPNITFDYSSYREPVTAYFNNTLYLFITHISSGDILLYKSDFEGNLDFAANCISVPLGYDYIYPVNTMFIDNTYYLFINVIYNDAITANDLQEIRVIESENLTEWNLNSTFIIDETLLTAAISEEPYYIDYIKNNDKDYIYISHADRIYPHYNAITGMSHTLFEVNNTPLNTSNYVPIYYENSTINHSYKYIPIGDNLYRVHYDFASERGIIGHVRGRNHLTADYSIAHKFYWNGLVESTSVNYSKANFADSFRIQYSLSYSMPDFNQTITQNTFYIRITLFDLNYKESGNSTFLKYDLYIVNQQTVTTITTNMLFSTTLVYPYDNLYGLYNGPDDAFRYCQGSIGYIGTKGYMSCQTGFLTSEFASFDAEFIVNPSDATLFSIIVEAPLDQKIGAITLIVGVVMTIGSFLSSARNEKIIIAGAYLIIMGIFFLTGLSFLGLAL